MAKIALLIGVSEYEPGLNPLPAAVRDVEALQKLLVNPAIGDFAESDVVLLKNPNRQTMEEAIETLFTGRSKDDLVLLFFSGHGIKDDAGRLFLTTSGTRKTIQGDLIRSTAVQSSFIQDSMSRSRSKRQVVILDSCFSGAFAEGLLARDDGTVDIRSQLGGEGRAILTSSSSTQYSFEYEGSELSLYTRFLIEGIETGAADADEDEVVSIDELHEYASRKVKEIKPELKPEIFAIREGFKIRLTKIPAIDPQQKYRREVARLMNYRGEISSINRRTLNIIKDRLQLDETEANTIEHEILEPTRIQFEKNLQEYELAFSDVIHKNENLTDSNREDLGQLQQILGLSDGDTRAIESQVKAQLQAYRQHLQEYEEVFRQALKLEYPLSDSQRVELQKVQKKLALKEADIESIQAKVTAEIEAYHLHLDQYKQLFIEATNQEYPLSDAKRSELLHQQENLGLSNLDVSTIEAEITTEIETYQQKLGQYQQAFVSVTQAKYLPTSPIRKQLQQTWQTLGLTEVDVIAIESPIIAQINLYQQNLEQYEKEFDSAVQQQYPLNEVKRNELTQLKLTLNLSDDDVTAIESPIKAVIAEHLDKLQQYEEAFLEAIQYEFPLIEETRQDLKQLQQILEVSNEDVEKIEAQILLSKTTVSKSTNEIESTQNQNVELLETPPDLLTEEKLSATLPPAVQPEYLVEEPSKIPNKKLPYYPPPSPPSESTSRIDWIDSYNKIIKKSNKILKKGLGFLFVFFGGILVQSGLVGLVLYLFNKSMNDLVWTSLFTLGIGLIFLQSGLRLCTNRPDLTLFKKVWIKSLYEKILTIPTPLRKKILIGISVLVFFLIMTFFVWSNLLGQVTKARESDGKYMIGAINRAQQVFHIEKAEFAPDFKSLDITVDSTYYNFSIPKPSVVIAVPIKTTDNLKSYIGGVSYNSTAKTFSTVICRQTGSEPLTIKNITGYGVVKEGEVACGPNTEKVE